MLERREGKGGIGLGAAAEGEGGFLAGLPPPLMGEGAE